MAMKPIDVDVYLVKVEKEYGGEFYVAVGTGRIPGEKPKKAFFVVPPKRAIELAKAKKVKKVESEEELKKLPPELRRLVREAARSFSSRIRPEDLE